MRQLKNAWSKFKLYYDTIQFVTCRTVPIYETEQFKVRCRLNCSSQQDNLFIRTYAEYIAIVPVTLENLRCA
jgi:hypothetical protein